MASGTVEEEQVDSFPVTGDGEVMELGIVTRPLAIESGSTLCMVGAAAAPH
jgi:hypothetical protein